MRRVHCKNIDNKMILKKWKLHVTKFSFENINTKINRSLISNFFILFQDIYVRNEYILF